MYEADMNWDQRVAADAALSERVTFIRKTYAHVAGSIVGFAIILAALVNFVPAQTMQNIFFGNRFSWLIVMGVFMVATMAAQRMANTGATLGTQYLGLALYTVAEALIFWPIIWIATNVKGMEGILPQAIILTLALAGGLTLSVFITKADFSWMRSALVVGSLVVFAAIIASIIFGFNIGIFFIVGVIALMCGFILYETSMVLHHYPTTQYVGAALAIFASLATLFWWVLRLLMEMRR